MACVMTGAETLANNHESRGLFDTDLQDHAQRRLQLGNLHQGLTALNVLCA